MRLCRAGWRQGGISDAEGGGVIDHGLHVLGNYVAGEALEEDIELIAAADELDGAIGGAAVAEAVDNIAWSKDHAVFGNLGPDAVAEDFEAAGNDGEDFVFVLVDVRRCAAAGLTGLAAD